ncbi:Aste57867_24120 [Aphanomyces stellatus]|uniref:Aste57867_24120 protein n=1 Tax=Aphanomyces stellatus TaxID=120398 RepID=A0A485LPJ7_9STRA|nr:hypothetical protein As57867_024046 [Aphanomyces stellatus]VFU00762.1 Aste57867_24120 [Aphanomyces stellatus]
MDGPFPTIAQAEALFVNKFQLKTGQTWAQRGFFVKMDGRYDLLRVDRNADRSATWEYYVNDFIDGKATGWYPYTVEGTAETEELWQTHQANHAYNQRIVHSGVYSYHINLDAMTQTNSSTNKRRCIRRILNGHVVVAPGLA